MNDFDEYQEDFACEVEYLFDVEGDMIWLEFNQEYGFE
jgi:hypothetical protein